MKLSRIPLLAAPAMLIAEVAIAQYPQMDFPLHIGDLWQYEEYGPPPNMSYEVRITNDTTMPNGMTYFKYSALLLRKEGPKVYWLRQPTEPKEEILFDFSKKIGDTVAIYYGTHDTGIVTVVEDDWIYYFGSWRRFMAFYEEAKQKSFYHLYYVTDSLGITWNQFEPGVQFYLKGAIMNGKTFGTVTVTKEEATRPGDYIIFQNFPNPFNLTTVLEFFIPKGQRVTITIFDQLGREVKNLVSAELPAGVNTIKWDGTNNVGKEVASGLYFYLVRGESFVGAKKMILLR